jgi:hypothetical protein
MSGRDSRQGRHAADAIMKPREDFIMRLPFILILLCSAGLAGAGPATEPALDSHGRTRADYDKHAAALKQNLPEGFTVVIEPPFVVTGDGVPQDVQAAATHTVKWAVEMLKKDYFDKDPDDILDVYLFKDKASYDKYTNSIFHDDPGTPYGYYAPSHKALIMNIATGGGTLVHEIVHPFVAANFPACPPWFNEGLGSLYEQSSERDGHIVGLTNWRLAGIQKAINDKKVPRFEKLFAMQNYDFYYRDRGTNYGQSRYLCYYLQENNLLHDYYKAFVKNQKTDPTGLETLKEVLKEKDLAAFQERWEKWVLTLRFP